MKHFISFIKSTTNFITILLSVVLSLLFWIFRPEQTVPLWTLFIAIAAAFFFLWAFLNSLFMLKSDINISDYSRVQICNEDICLCTPAPALSHGVFVTIYLVRNECEHRIGYGEVSNIQDNGLVSLVINQLPQTIVANDSRPFHQIISENKNDIRIKTTVSRKIIDTLIKEAHSHEEIQSS